MIESGHGIDWGHVIEAVGIAVGNGLMVILYIMSNKRGARKEAQERNDTTQKKLDSVISEQKYLRPHDHQEHEGALMAEGIIRKRRDNGPQS